MSPAFLSVSMTKMTLNIAMVFFFFLFIVVLEMYASVPVPSEFFSKPAALQASSSSSSSSSSSRRLSKEASDGGLDLGLLGETMVAMLGSTDLPFTIFVPSKDAFHKLSKTFFPQLSEEQAAAAAAEKSLTVGNNSDVYAALSHVFSFSAVPKPIFSDDLPEEGGEEEEMEAEALSGYKLYLSRVPGRGVLVNNLVCELTDLRRGHVVMHVVNGVLLDPTFGRSIALENEEVDDENKQGDGS